MTASRSLITPKKNLFSYCSAFLGAYSQHLLAAVPMHLSRDFARQHDEAITEAVAKALELGELNARDKLLLQRKISDHELLPSQELVNLLPATLNAALRIAS